MKKLLPTFVNMLQTAAVKSALVVLTGLVSLCASVSAVAAATLTIDSIGGVPVGLTMPTTWTHQGNNPLFQGDASPSAAVQFSIDSVAYTTTANALGQWSYQPTSLTTSGSHEIVVSSGIENLIFTLTLTSASGSATKGGATASGTTTATQPALPAQLPSTGSNSITTFLGLGLVMLGVSAVAFVVTPKYLEQEL